MQRRIRKVLKDSGVTQKELAERTHIDPANMSRIISGKMAPYKGWMVRIAEVLGWTEDPENLFEEVED